MSHPIPSRSMRCIIAHAARVSGMPPGRIVADDRKDHAAMDLRRIVAIEAKRRGHSWHAIGAALGGRDHSTVLEAARVGRAMISQGNMRMAQALAELRAAVDAEPMRPRRVPAVLIEGLGEPEAEPCEDDPDAALRLRGTIALADALRRAHPERMVTPGAGV